MIRTFMKGWKRCLWLSNTPDTDRRSPEQEQMTFREIQQGPVSYMGAQLSSCVSDPHCSQGDNSLLAAQQGGSRVFEATQLWAQKRGTRKGEREAGRKKKKGKKIAN